MTVETPILQLSLFWCLKNSKEGILYSRVELRASRMKNWHINLVAGKKQEFTTFNFLKPTQLEKLDSPC